jgi:hypothetical protein
MSGLILALFTSPLSLTGPMRMLLLVPLCLSLSIVYKTIKCDDLRAVPLAAVVLCVTILVSMYAVGVGLWIFYVLFA